jgi:O-antigen biosynthesis protein
MKGLQKVLIIGQVWPEPDSSAAGKRMMQLISIFQSIDAEITFASAAAQTHFSENLDQIGVKTVSVQVNDSNFDLILKSLNPDLVIFDRFMIEEQFGWRIAENCPDALRVLDTEDLHCLRKTRQDSIEKGIELTNEMLLTSEISKREIASIYRSDLSLFISEAEITLLQNLFNVDSRLYHYLPIMANEISKKEMDQLPQFKERKHFVHIGNFRHPPNLDSVLFMKSEVWPHIRQKLPDVELHLYGAYPTEKVTKLNDPVEGFLVKGRAESAKNVMKNARVCLAPLRYGAGLKGKLLEAMECGTPSVTTDIGSEGINGDLPWNGFISTVDQPKKLADCAVLLYSNQKIWEKNSYRGFRILNKRFTGLNFIDNLIKRLSEIRKKIKTHRANNFIGGMLMYHTAASTKYMSRWIEAKNQS